MSPVGRGELEDADAAEVGPLSVVLPGARGEAEAVVAERDAVALLVSLTVANDVRANLDPGRRDVIEDLHPSDPCR